MLLTDYISVDLETSVSFLEFQELHKWFCNVDRTQIDAVPKYNQQDATLHGLFISALHISGGSPTHHQEHKTVSTKSGICQTVTATCR